MIGALHFLGEVMGLARRVAPNAALRHDRITEPRRQSLFVHRHDLYPLYCCFLVPIISE